jgi:hypothetical protein
MPEGLGYRYQPGQTPLKELPLVGGTPGKPSPQEAVRVLSLRIPKREAPGAIAPLPLLQAQGGGQGSGLEMLLQALMASFGKRQPMQGQQQAYPSMEELGADRAGPPGGSVRFPAPRIIAGPPVGPAQPPQGPSYQPPELPDLPLNMMPLF